MSIKIVLLKSGETIITDAKELLSEDKICGYLLKNPHKILISKNNQVFLLEEEKNEEKDEYDSSWQISLSPWIALTKDKEIPIPPDWVVTIVDPIDSVTEIYEEKVNGKESQVSFTEE